MIRNRIALGVLAAFAVNFAMSFTVNAVEPAKKKLPPGTYVMTPHGRSLEQAEEIYKTIPPLKYTPPADRWANLPKTKKALESGGKLTVVMLGDSIVNDTSRSGWEKLLQRDFPNTKITKVTSVRGSTGCWWYKDDNRVEPCVLEHDPDLLIIGGISQRNDIEAIREVIKQVRNRSGAEVLLMTGAFGTVDPRDPKQWQYEIDTTTDNYRASLQKLAKEMNCGFLDMRAAWGKYICESGKELDWFHRDPVHANDRGEQIIGRILKRFLTPDENKSTPAS